MTEKPLRALIVEDSEDDTLLLKRELAVGGYQVVSQRVDTPEAMRSALAEQPWDIVFADYTMPRFDGMSALRLLRQRESDIPFGGGGGAGGGGAAGGAGRAGARGGI